jgi:hypothetical protein
MAQQPFRVEENAVLHVNDLRVSEREPALGKMHLLGVLRFDSH